MNYEDTHQLGRLILKLANTLIKNRNRHLEALGLTTSQADSLQYFLANPESTVTDLKDYLEITHQTARGLVQRIEEKGLVSLTPSVVDGRCRSISPTENGKDLGVKMAHNREMTVLRLLSGMTEEEQERYDAYNKYYGNRDYLFDLNSIPTGSSGFGYDNIKNEEKEMLS